MRLGGYKALSANQELGGVSQEHLNILKAVQKQDRKAVGEAVEKHMASTLKKIIGRQTVLIPAGSSFPKVALVEQQIPAPKVADVSSRSRFRVSEARGGREDKAGHAYCGCCRQPRHLRYP